MPSSKQLLITSDDFGMSYAVNQGIIQSFHSGILQSSNIMVPCPWAKHAAQASIKESLEVGIHLTLTCEWSHYHWRPLTSAPSLMTSDYTFHDSVSQLYQNSREEEIFSELEAQFNLLESWGVNITHVDSHMIPSHPQGEAEQYFNQLMRDFAQSKKLLYTYETSGNTLKYFDSEFRLSENTDQTAWDYLHNLEAGTHHLISHCAIDSEEQAAIAPQNPWSQSKRLKDFQFLNSPAFKELIQQEGIELINIKTLSQN